MKWIVLLFTAAMSLNGGAHGHKAPRVALESATPSPFKAGSIQYSFRIVDRQTKKSLSDQDLIESHTQKIHLIVYDASLNEFVHLHPVYDGKKWSTEISLARNGKYFFWAQGTLKDSTEFSALQIAEVNGGQLAHPIAVLPEKRKGADGTTVLELTKDKLKAGEMTMLDYKVTRQDGQPPVVTPYLGANAHIIAVSPDGQKLIHVHPMDGSAPTEGMLHATFPKAGNYRVWIQLIDGGGIKTIPLAVTVTK